MHSDSLRANFVQSRVATRLLDSGRACAGGVPELCDFGIQAQGPGGYPTKPVRLLVPYGAGGVGDQTMRLLANKLSQQVKQQLVIENRPSAGGIISMTEGLRAAPDGYTLVEMGNGQAISMSLFSNLQYELLRDFVPISVAGSFSIMLGVPDRSPYKTLQQLVEAARAQPGKLNVGAINPGSTQNLSAHLFQQITGVSFTVVPYRTSPDLMTALLRGDVDLGFDYYAAFQSVIGPGKVRIVATTGDAREPLLKDVADRQGEQDIQTIYRDRLERDRCARGRVRRNNEISQCRDQPSFGFSGPPGEVPRAGYRPRRDDSRSNVGAHGARWRQVARRDREGWHPKAVAPRATIDESRLAEVGSGDVARPNDQFRSIG